MFFTLLPAGGVSADTPTIDCSAHAGTPVACDWSGYFADIGEWLTDPENAPARFVISEPEPAIDSPFVPAGWEAAATYRAEPANGGGMNWISLLIYDSVDAADEAATALIDELTTAFWREEPGRGLEEGDTCLSLIREESARSLCLAQRDETVIVGYAFLEIDVSDWTLIYAAELTRLLIDAHEAIARSTR